MRIRKSGRKSDICKYAPEQASIPNETVRHSLHVKTRTGVSETNWVGEADSRKHPGQPIGAQIENELRRRSAKEGGRDKSPERCRGSGWVHLSQPT